ncbi:MAG: hypothetical protein ACSLFR_03840 [Solirubrobacteraceae bacterium]
MLPLDPASRAELDAIGDEHLTRAVERVLADPSGRREPRHNYTRLFRNPRAYVSVRSGERVWEFRTNHWRALFVLVDRDGRSGIFFVPIRGKRFLTMGEAPWH